MKKVMTICLVILACVSSAQASVEMVLIPGGQFEMGDHHDGMGQSLPVHLVYLDSFYISKSEVTNRQYCDYLNSALAQTLIEANNGVVYAVGGSNPYCDTYSSDSESQIIYSGGAFSVNTKDGIDMSNHPMVEVTWYGAKAYCDYYGYRLPTEAEWEYAARGGQHDPYYRYPWGDSIDGSKANYWESGDSYESGNEPWTTPVQNYPANGYGLHDMIGNVWEWCSDWFDTNYYSVSPYENPQGPVSGTIPVCRGCSWASVADPAASCRVATRNGAFPDTREYHLGFRVVRSASLDDGLVAYFPFEGNANDVSGNGNDGTENGSPSYADGLCGQALSLDGSSDISLPEQPVSDLFADRWTISFFAIADSVDDVPSFGFEGSGIANANNPVHSYGNANGIVGIGDGINPDAQILVTLPDTTSDTWTHYTIVDDGTNYIIYVNGQVYYSELIQIDPGSSSDRAFLIGQSGFDVMPWVDNRDNFIGKFDEFRIYDRALSACEIAELAAECEPEPCFDTDQYEFMTKWGDDPADEQFEWLASLDVDSEGNVYVGDNGTNQQVKKFETSDGINYTFVTKWGSKGTGDGQFGHALVDMCVDLSGYVYVCDHHSHRVQKFDSNGIFMGWWGACNHPGEHGSTNTWHDPGSGHSTTVYGNGNGQFKNPTGIGVDSEGYVYVGDHLNYRIQKFTSCGEYVDQWPCNPCYFLGVDPSADAYVYALDPWSNSVKKFTSDGTLLTSWGEAGNGDGQFNWPHHIKVDSSGYVYVCDSFSNRIQKFSSDGEFIMSLGSGPGNADGEFDKIYGLAIDSFGYVYAGDNGNSRVQKFKPICEPEECTQLDLLVSSELAKNVTRYDGQTCEFEETFIPPQSAALHRITFGPDGNLYASVHPHDQILRFNGATGSFIDIFATPGPDGPVDLVFGDNGNLYVSSHHDSKVLRYDGISGLFIDDFVPALSGGLSGARGLTFGPDYNLYVCSSDTNQVIRYDGCTGAFIDIFVDAAPNGPNYPVYIVFGPDGDLYVSSHLGHEVLRYDGTTGEFVDVCIPSSYGLNKPQGLIFDQDNKLYVASSLSNEVICTDCITHNVFANVDTPSGMAFLTQPCNTTPVADAGYDQTVPTGPDGSAEVVLDCSGSSDPDGDDLTYCWKWTGGQECDAIGVNPTLVLPCGTYTIELVVNDGNVDSEPDYVEITIPDGTTPEITCPANMILECPADTDPCTTGFATATDNCDPEPVIAFYDDITPGCGNTKTIVRTWTATDASGNSNSCSQIIIVQDTTPPVITGVPVDTTVECDSVPIPAQPTATDNCDTDVPITFTEVRTDGDCFDSYALTRTWTAMDDCGNTADQSRIITVVDTTSPVISNLNADYLLSQVGQTVNFFVDVLDNCDSDVGTQWNFGDGTTSSSNPVHEYMQAGIYTVTVTATDNCGNAATDSIIIVVYDPAAGFTTGGGWFVPDSDSFVDGELVTDTVSRANFGFIVKYKKGADDPDGNLEFQYKAGDINLKSLDMEWLVIQSATKVRFKGLATINGQGEYTFKVTAEDNGEPGTGLDIFCIEIWLGVVDDVENSPPTPKHKAKGVLGGGNIRIHQK